MDGPSSRREEYDVLIEEVCGMQFSTSLCRALVFHLHQTSC